jgi:glutamine synthetase
MLTGVFESIAKGKAKGPKDKQYMTVGVDTLPPLPKDYGDRNRTSPFAFTGNKFEFRAVGSSQSIAGPLVALNTIVAESLDYVATELEKSTKGDPRKLGDAATKLVQQIWKDHSAVVFNGDGYSEKWHKEAEKRGLPNLKNTVDALPALVEKDVTDLLAKYSVLSERETHARYEIYAERYCKDVATEAKLCLQIARQQILPAAYRYQGELASTVAALKTAGKSPDSKSLDTICKLVGELEAGIDKLSAAIDHHCEGPVIAHAKHYRDEVVPAMLEVRKSSDALECVVAQDLWPLPIYQEMLFIK